MSDDLRPQRPIDVPPHVRALCERLRQAGHQAYVVGGCVRDRLLGREPPDWDVATSARPEEVQKLFPRVVPTGIKHGTVTVLCGHAPGAAAGAPELHVEVTTFRGEGAYTDGRRPDVVHFVRTIEEDLARRDFTINAIAYDSDRGALIDPFGGLADLAARRIRAVGDPRERFGEDGLRAMRAVRFAATLEFDVDEATLAAIPERLDVFRKVSAERVRDELMKLLGAARPSRGLELMQRSGLLGATIPELVESVGCAQNRYHRHDVWGHTMAVVDGTPLSAPSGRIVRLGALLHDVAKPRCRAPHPEHPGEHTFHRHDVVGAEMAEQIGHRLRLSNDERECVTELVRHHLFYYTPEWSDATVRRFIRRVGPDRIDDLFALRQGDVIGRGFGEDPESEIGELRARIAAELSRAAALKVTDLAVGGREVMEVLGIPPSRRVGEVLETLLERVIDDPSLNTRERLLEALQGLRG